MGFQTTFRRIASISLITLLSGCTHNMVRDMAGSGMVSFGNEYITPWFMASDDTDVMCAMGEGMGAMTFPLGPATDPMVPMLTLASGMCADERAKEEELRYIRAMRKNDAEEAQDARTMQKRWAGWSMPLCTSRHRRPGWKGMRSIHIGMREAPVCVRWIRRRLPPGCPRAH